jgi:hypothetical protein
MIPASDLLAQKQVGKFPAPDLVTKDLAKTY